MTFGIARAVLAISSVIGLGVSAGASAVETLVLVRHGEKPANVDNGQLTCRGQNRALALPNVLIPRYGVPGYVFAVAPTQKQDDNGTDYWYLRALGTIEPTAVAAGVTINLKFGKSDIDKLETELAKTKYQNATVFLAWEHNELVNFATNVVRHNGGDPGVVPDWPSDDYDSVYALTLTRAGGVTSVAFAHDSEALGNYLSPDCSPQPRGLLPRPPVGR